jgi:hypothetical protein
MCERLEWTREEEGSAAFLWHRLCGSANRLQLKNYPNRLFLPASLADSVVGHFFVRSSSFAGSYAASALSLCNSPCSSTDTVIVVLVHTSHLDLSLIRSFGFDISVPHQEG